MTRTEFFAAAAAGVAAMAAGRAAQAELVIQKVTPETVGDSGFEVAFRRRESGLLSFSILRERTTADMTLRLNVGPVTDPVVICFLEPRETTRQTRRALVYRFEIGEKYLADAQLTGSDAPPKQLGGTTYQFDLKSFVDHKAK